MCASHVTGASCLLRSEGCVVAREQSVCGIEKGVLSVLEGSVQAATNPGNRRIGAPIIAKAEDLIGKSGDVIDRVGDTTCRNVIPKLNK
jgi:hypothetical protein